MTDLVNVWEVPLSDGVHMVEFEHGTTSGMRAIRVDNKEILRRNWMFKLVGREHFKIGDVKASINIDASGGFSYEYTLEVNGKTLQKFYEQRSKTTKVWLPVINGEGFRIVLGFSYEYTLEVNGKTLQKFYEQRSKTTKVWLPVINGEGFRIVLEKDSMKVWCNGQVMETAGEFVDDGAETHFTLTNGMACYIKAVSSGKTKEGIIHSLIINDNEIPEAIE